MANSAPANDVFFLAQDRDGTLGRQFLKSHGYYQDLVANHSDRVSMLLVAGMVVLLCGRLLRLLFDRCLPAKEFKAIRGHLGHFLVMLYLYFVCLLVLGYVFKKWGGNSQICDFLSFWAINGIFCLCMLVGTIFLQKNPKQVLGIRPIWISSPTGTSFSRRCVPPALGIFAIFAGYVLFVPFYLSSYVVSHLMFACFGVLPAVQEVAQRLFEAQGAVRWLGFFTAVVGAPLLEEFIFRVFLYGNLRKWLGVSGAVIASSLIFALCHGDLFVFWPIFTLGAFLAFLYERTQSVFAPMLAHALHNGVALVYMSLTVG